MLKGSKENSEYDFSGSCGFFLAAVIVTLICQAAAGVVSASLVNSHPDIGKDGDFNTAFMIIIQIINAGFIYLFTRVKRRKFNFTYFTRESDGKRRSPSVFIVPILCGALVMIGMYLPTIWYGELLIAMGLPPEFGNVELTTPSSVAMLVIASVLLAPVMEETIYRGVLLHGLVKERNAAISAVLSAAAFMLMHMNPVQVVFQFALGLVCAFIVLRSGRLFPAMLAHAAANALALLIELTELGTALSGSVIWLKSDPASAVFITLGLFAAAGGLLFFAVRCGFDFKAFVAKIKGGKKKEVEAPAEKAEEPETAGQNETAVKMAAVRKRLGIKEGRIKYWIAAGICIVMLIVNLIVGIVT